MASLSGRFSRCLLQTATHRRPNLVCASTCTTSLSRRWFSDATASSAASPTAETTMSADAPEAPVRKRPGRKPKVHTESTAELPNEKEKKRLGRPPKHISAVEGLESGDPCKPDIGRPNSDKIPRKYSRKFRPKKPQAVKEDATRVSFLELPPAEEWHHYFPVKKETAHRTMISNTETARILAEKFVPEGSKDKIIIEANPGAGLLSRALLALPRERVQKLILLDEAEVFLPALLALQEADPRVVVVPKEGKQWSTYTELRNEGILDSVKTLPWEQEHDQLQFIMSIPHDVYGEQLVAQLMRTVPDRQWLYQYGRMPMHLILPTRLWERLYAPVGTLARGKVAAMAEAVANCHECLPPLSLLPHWEHFYPTRYGKPLTVMMTACSIIPKAEQMIPPGELEFWDHCMRKLFVLRATPVKDAMVTLGPGASNLIPKMTDPSLPEEQRVDVSKSPRKLELREWQILVNTFKNWPFRPTDLALDTFRS